MVNSILDRLGRNGRVDSPHQLITHPANFTMNSHHILYHYRHRPSSRGEARVRATKNSKRRREKKIILSTAGWRRRWILPRETPAKKHTAALSSTHHIMAAQQ